MENNQPVYNNVNTQFKQLQDHKNNVKVIFFLLIIFLLILAIVVFVGYWIKFKTERSGGPESIIRNQEDQKKLQDKVLTVKEDFPFLKEPVNVYFDQDDKNILWVSFSGAVIKYNLEKDTFEVVLRGVTGLDNSPHSFLRKGDDIFFSLFQGGFEKVNIKNGNRKIYTIADGLPNNANIQIFDDPYTDYIWIATFEGLSRFDYKKEIFNNLKDQLGFRLQINNIVVDKDYVWAVISANAYSPGGVIRIDKTLGTWKEWGPKDFDKNSSRVDILSGLDAVNGRAIVDAGTTNNRSENKIMEYDPELDLWKELFVTDKKSYNQFTYFGDKIYFVGSGYSDNRVYYLDITKDEIIPDTYVMPGAQISRDSDGKRLVIVDWPNKIVVMDPKINNYKTLKFDKKDIFLTKLIGAEDDNLIFINEKQIIIHNLPNKSNRIIDSFGMVTDRSEGKILGDYLVSIATGGEGMMSCGLGKFVLINLRTGLIEKSLDIPDCFDSIMFGKDISEIFIGTTSYKTKDIESVKRYIVKTNKFEKQDLAFINFDNITTFFSPPISKIKSPDGILVEYLYNSKDINNQIAKFQISKLGKIYTKQIVFNSSLLDGFNSPVGLDVNAMAFDRKDSSKLLIGTNLGLIIYDIEKDIEYKITTDKGLVSNNIKKIIPLKDSFVIIDNTGAYIYSADYSKLK